MYKRLIYVNSVKNITNCLRQYEFLLGFCQVKSEVRLTHVNVQSVLNVSKNEKTKIKREQVIQLKRYNINSSFLIEDIDFCYFSKVGRTAKR